MMSTDIWRAAIPGSTITTGFGRPEDRPVPRIGKRLRVDAGGHHKRYACKSVVICARCRGTNWVCERKRVERAAVAGGGGGAAVPVVQPIRQGSSTAPT